MKRSSIIAVLALAGLAHADPQEDLAFAARLGARGFDEMAFAVLDRLENSRDPDEARAGRYGKAQLQRQKATLARLRFLNDLEAGVKPRVNRDEVLAAFKDAMPKVEEYVKSRPEDYEARFLLAELLQEHAEFLTGAEYPEEMVEERKQLLDAHSAEAEGEFRKAIEHYGKVYETLAPKLGDEPAFDSREYILATNARYKKANARMRWSLMYPSGPKFQNYSEQALEELDEFFGIHYDDVYGGFAMLDLGQVSLARGLRLKDGRSDAETAVEYFSTLYNQMADDPALPVTGEIMAKAFYWHGRACNAIARGEGKLAKPNPLYLERAIKGGAKQREKLKFSAKNRWALRSLLEIADAYAMQGRFGEAVSLAGEVLAGARVEGHGGVMKTATAKLTGWVANVAGAGTLGPDLLFQIGESLSAQDATSNAITFYEKAIAAAADDEDNKEKYAYPARLRIASAYRKDQRYLAAAEVAMDLVDEYLTAGAEEESPFGQVASEACNVARIVLKVVADATKRPGDQSEYERVVGIFRSKFPSHSENADKEFATAKEAYNDKKFEQAAQLLQEIREGTPNYWLAQRMVPQCYRNLAIDAEDEAAQKRWHEQALAVAKELVAKAAGKDDPGAKRAEQFGELFTAMSHASLGNWKETAEAITAYQKKYPGVYLKRGLELKIEVDAYIQLGELEKAEAALAKLKKAFPTSSLFRRSAYDVYRALRKKFKASSGATRVAVANRAAEVYLDWFKTVKDPDHGLFFFLGDTLAAAERYKEASEAMENAASLVPAGSNQQAGYNLMRSKYAMRHLLNDKTMDSRARTKALKETRESFTSVIIPPDPKDPDKQQKVLKALAASKWPSREIFAQIKRNPQALLDAAEIFSQSSPEGMDGRTIAIRLLTHLHSFTRPSAPEGNETLAELVPVYWDGAELKLQIYIMLAESGRDTRSKKAASTGAAFARKLLFEYPNTGGDEERATRFAAYEKKLQQLSR